MKILSAALLAAAALPVQAQLIEQKALSMPMALTIAQTAVESCKASGYNVSVHVLGREGQVLVALRGDGSSPHTFENSLRKAYTARTFKSPSGEFAQKVRDNPAMGQVHLANIVATQGGLPIAVGDDVIGGVGVSGAPGGEKDEVCAKAGLDKVAAQLR